MCSIQVEGYAQVWTVCIHASSPRFLRMVLKLQLFRLLAKSGEVARQVGVFGGEDGFACFDIRKHRFCIAVVEVIFGDGEVVNIYEVGNLIGGVLLPDGKSALWASSASQRANFNWSS